MEERIYTYKVTVNVEAEPRIANKKVHLLMTEGKFSVDYSQYKTKEEALESFLDLTKCYYEGKKYVFKSNPYVYEVTNASRSISAKRLAFEEDKDACFLLDSFEKCSLNEIVMFLKEYGESDYSKQFTCVSLLPNIGSNVSRGECIAFCKNSTIEQMQEELLKTDLIGYLHL